MHLPDLTPIGNMYDEPLYSHCLNRNGCDSVKPKKSDLMRLASMMCRTLCTNYLTNQSCTYNSLTLLTLISELFLFRRFDYLLKYYC